MLYFRPQLSVTIFKFVPLPLNSRDFRIDVGYLSLQAMLLNLLLFDLTGQTLICLELIGSIGS